MKFSKRLWICVVISLAWLLNGAAAQPDPDPAFAEFAQIAEREILLHEEKDKLINEQYLKTVKPIFAEKCLACHDRHLATPWYATLPWVGQVIEHHRQEALADYDMSEDFPFTGKLGLGERGLKKLEKTIRQGDMPPASYVMVHWGSRLNAAESKTVLDWIDFSLKTLADKRNNAPRQ